MKTTKEKIIEAALKMFSQHGYHKATTQAIAKAAEVNEVTLFRHFGSKQKIFAEVIKQYSAIPHIDQARVDRSRPFDKRLEQLTDAVIHIFKERKDLISIVLSEGTKQSKEAEQILESGPAEVLRRLTEWFAEEQIEGKMRQLPPEFAARALLGMFLTYILFPRLLPQEKMSSKEEKKVQKAFLDIFLYGTLPNEKKK